MGTHRTIVMGILSNFSIKEFRSNMFRSKTLDVLTCFHKPSVSASTRVVNLLKQASAQSQAHATEDQASDHTPQNTSVTRDPFELDITEAPPTPDQLKNIFEYLGSGKAAQLVKGAASESGQSCRRRERVGDSQACQRAAQVVIMRQQ